MKRVYINGRMVRRERLLRDMNQTDFAQKLGVSQNLVSKIEASGRQKGHEYDPRGTTYHHLAAQLQLRSVDELMMMDGEDGACLGKVEAQDGRV